MRSSSRHLRLKSTKKRWKTASLVPEREILAGVRPPMLKLGKKLATKKQYPGKAVVKKVAALLADKILSERN